jgi:hypothetical protein
MTGTAARLSGCLRADLVPIPVGLGEGYGYPPAEFAEEDATLRIGVRTLESRDGIGEALPVPSPSPTRR